MSVSGGPLHSESDTNTMIRFAASPATAEVLPHGTSVSGAGNPRDSWLRHRIHRCVSDCPDTVGRVVEDAEQAQESYTPIAVEMAWRKAHIDDLPGSRLKDDLEALNRCSYTFGENAKQLATHMASFLGTGQHVHKVSEEYVLELVRLLHNYLMSVTTLIEAQRVVMRHRWPAEKKDGKSEFERNDYTNQLGIAFDSGEAAFMVKLRNYSTHYAIPVPGISTTMSWGASRQVELVNALKLDRDLLLRFDGWGAVAKGFLEEQESKFDFAPIIERYMKSAREFFAWFWDQINRRSSEAKAELHCKATELFLWYSEQDVRPEWMTSGGEPPPGWNGRRELRRKRAQKRIERYAYGSRGHGGIAVDSRGVAMPGEDSWTPLPR